MSTPAALKERAQKEVDSLRTRLIELSHTIHANPELSFHEHETSKLLASELAKVPRFKVETGVGGLPTAFRATIQGAKPGPRVAILSEYDGLPRVGHACGHNIIGTSAIGAGLALAAVADQIAGTIEVIGTPAEETGGGKVIMLNRGVFDDVDAAVIMHPHLGTYLCLPMLGMRSLPMEFRGRSSHGAQSPHDGRSALAGVIQTFNAVDALRQHIVMDARIHGIITSGGERPNIIPEYAACHFFVRAPEAAYLDDLTERVKNCARGAALMTDTQVTFLEPEFPDYQPFRPSWTIAEYYTRNVESLGEPVHQLPDRYLYASNDMGNLSRRLPVVAMMFRITTADKLPDHSREFAEAAKSPLGDNALILAAKSMAMTAVDLFCDHSIVEKAKAEVKAAKIGRGNG